MKQTMSSMDGFPKRPAQEKPHSLLGNDLSARRMIAEKNTYLREGLKTQKNEAHVRMEGDSANDVRATET